jgi:hypothetical protein
MTVAAFLDRAAGCAGRWQSADGEPRAVAPAKTVYGYMRAELE